MMRKRMSQGFINRVTELNNISEPFVNADTLIGDQKIITNAPLSEYPAMNDPTRDKKQKPLSSVLKDYSDFHRDAQDLDTNGDNLTFLQNTIKSLVRNDTRLGESNINLSEGAVPQLPR